MEANATVLALQKVFNYFKPSFLFHFSPTKPIALPPCLFFIPTLIQV